MLESSIYLNVAVCRGRDVQLPVCGPLHPRDDILVLAHETLPHKTLAGANVIHADDGLLATNQQIITCKQIRVCPVDLTNDDSIAYYRLDDMRCRRSVQRR